MIKQLRKRFIAVSTISLLSVFLLIFIGVYLLNTRSVNRTMDTLTDTLSENDGNFPPYFPQNGTPPEKPSPNIEGTRRPNFFSRETPFSTRFFTVAFNESGEILSVNLTSIEAVSEEQAREYAVAVSEKRAERGWTENYRYKLYDTEEGYSIVFVDGSMNKAMSYSFLYIIGFILLGTAFVVILLTIFLSKKAMKPIADSYDKQRQFVTDANHELKTPLALINTNLDILEEDVGKNEWIDGIRHKSEQMTCLVNELVTLSRMDEGRSNAVMTKFAFSEAVLDAISEFEPLARESGKRLYSEVSPNIFCRGDEGAIRRLISVLLDNAIKYCDSEGEIFVSLRQKRNIILTVENSYRAVESVELDKLFDRFYRSDKARTSGSGFGIGLSIAKSIVKQHRGDITAYKKDSTHIGFKVKIAN